MREKRQQEVAQEKRRRNLIWGGVAAVIVIGVAAVVFLQSRPISGIQEFPGLSRNHDESITYTGLTLPPAGGVHHPVWLNCGVYDAPVTIANAIHSLEHGAVWISYDPSMPAEQIDRVEDYADNLTLISPFPDQESPIVVTAWGAQLQVDELPDGRVDDFIGRYKGQGPEPGATCSGGIGAPRS
jgi:hypothetical protein